MDDAISRSAAYISLSDALDTIYNIDISDCTDVDDIIGRIYEAVGEIPDSGVAPVVHARWIYYGDADEDGNCEANCSACGAGDAHRPDLKNAVPYCWNCGARMDGEEND